MANPLSFDDFTYMISRIRNMVSLMKEANSRIKNDRLARSLMDKFSELVCGEVWTSREDADTAYHTFDEYIKDLIKEDLTIIPA